MKRSRNEEEEKKHPFALKWKTVRVYPNSYFTNGMELTEHKKYKIDSLNEYIDAEIEVQKRVFSAMGCNETASAKALTALRAAYESSPANKTKE